MVMPSLSAVSRKETLLRTICIKAGGQQVGQSVSQPSRLSVTRTVMMRSEGESYLQGAAIGVCLSAHSLWDLASGGLQRPCTQEALADECCTRV